MTLFLLIVLSVLSAYAAGIIAERQDRNVRSWQWLGALFGPLALFVIILPRTRKDSANSAQRR